MQRAALLLGFVLICGPAMPTLAQTLTPAQAPAQAQGVPILTIDQERLFAESLFGRAALARLKASEDALVAENLRIEAALEVEERDLTARRAVLPAAEFRALADAFDAKVEGVRAAQRAKYTDLTAAHEADKRVFLQAAVPIIGQLMQEQGAVAVMDKATIFLSLQRIEITDLAIVRLDAAIGDGTAPPALPETPLPTVPVQP
jgi:Skp family chaperone for outer membrane proteins